MKIINVDAARRAIEWAKTNPGRILGGELATTSDGVSVSTMSPEAICFCLVGRVAREAGVDTRFTNEGLAAFIEEIDMCEDNDEADQLWISNDDGVKHGDPLRGFRLLEEKLA